MRLALVLLVAGAVGACGANENGQPRESTTVPLDPGVTPDDGLADPRCNPAANLLRDPSLGLTLVLEGESFGSFGPEVELPEITDESVLCVFSAGIGSDGTRDVLVTGSEATEVFLSSSP